LGLAPFPFYLFAFHPNIFPPSPMEGISSKFQCSAKKKYCKSIEMWIIFCAHEGTVKIPLASESLYNKFIAV
jgi:hypothetical protein